MAVSRVGGTKGKLTGQVGSIVFQVRKNADGSYAQITYEKGERVETQLTPKVQAQRMCVAMVESLMRDLKPIATISYQAGKNKTQSLNSFAAQNLRLLQRDCKEHWYSDNLFVYPRHRRTDLNVRDLGGRWLISSGSLSKNCFDRQIFDIYPAATFKGDISRSDYFYGLWFDCPVGQMTVNQFRQAHKMTYNDSYCFAGFYQGLTYDAQEGSIVTSYSNSYMIVKNNMKVPSSQVMDDATIMDLFVWKSDLKPVILIAKDNSGFAIGILTDYYEYDEQFYYTAAFTINYATGKKQISTSFYENPGGGDDPWLIDAAPADVFGTWMGEPSVKPYPSPWAQPVPWRIPADFQEVEWIKNLSGDSIEVPDIFKPFVSRLEFRLVGDLNQIKYIFFGRGTVRWLRIRCLLRGSGYIIRFELSKNSTEKSSFDYGQNDTAVDSLFVFEPRNGKYLTICNGVEQEITFAPWVYDDFVESFFIFGGSSSGSVYQMYEMIATDVRDGSLIFDLVPCYRKTNGFCGFYDLVSQQFFSAQKNVGEYEHGPLVKN